MMTERIEEVHHVETFGTFQSKDVHFMAELVNIDKHENFKILSELFSG